MRKEKAAGDAGQPLGETIARGDQHCAAVFLTNQIERGAREDVVERACKVWSQAANVGRNHRAVRVVECRATVELSHRCIAFCFDRRLSLSRERFQCCLSSDGTLRRSEYLCEVRCFGLDKRAVRDSAERRRTAQWSQLAFGSLVQGCERLQQESTLGSFAEVTLDEVVQEVRELFFPSQGVPATRTGVQVPNPRRPLPCLDPSF